MIKICIMISYFFFALRKGLWKWKLKKALPGRFRTIDGKYSLCSGLLSVEEYRRLSKHLYKCQLNK